MKRAKIYINDIFCGVLTATRTYHKGAHTGAPLHAVLSI